MTEPQRDPEHDEKIRLIRGRPKTSAAGNGGPVFIPRSPRAPHLVGASVGFAGILSLLSTAGPMHERIAPLTNVVPLSVRTNANSVAALTGLGLLVVAGGLWRRQRLAWWVALGLLILAGISHILKDLDVITAALVLGLAVTLVVNRAEFDAKPGPGSVRRAIVTFPLLASVVWWFGALTLLSHAKDFTPRPGFGEALSASARGAVGLSPGITSHSGDSAWILGLLPILGVVAAVSAFALMLRPVVEGLRRSAADADVAQDIVRRHGSDTLSYFALRHDKSYFFCDDGFVAYRYLWNLGLVSGDPVCAPEMRASVMEAFVRHARGMGWGVAVLAGSEEMEPVYRRLGLRPFYLGDEAILDPRTFSLEGRWIRKVRQSGHRLTRSGYTIAYLSDADIDPDLRDALDGVTASWRGRAPERGFTMSMDRSPSPQDRDALTVVARDSDGRAQGYLHLVPCYGEEPGFSLDQMRRRPDTPNGLMEWMVAETALELGRRGSARFSLNFAVRGRIFDDQFRLTLLQRVEAKLLGWLNPFFQLERLWSFNDKFGPTWRPRFIYYEAPLSLPRVVLAYLEAEAFLRLPLIGTQGRLRHRMAGGAQARAAAPTRGA
ncbi:MAG: lysyl-tRNA synthetase, class [Actinomycetota bacterium]|nr:lysyl-tRNA synthetase, class [Actinomycetota bacterium]